MRGHVLARSAGQRAPPSERATNDVVDYGVRMTVDPESGDRRAIEAVLSQSLDDEWPASSMKPGTRVRIIQDSAWAGPWREVFIGTIDATFPPQPVRNKNARPGELRYSVRFDESQFDADGDGPYREAVIWERYLELL